MRTRVLTLLLLAGVLAGCGNEGSTPSEAPKAAGSAPSAHQGDGLSRDEFVFATKVAKHEQRSVKGTFVGATARADGPGVLQIRLVWDSANFTHGGVVGGLPDGPRQALVFTARIADGSTSPIGAMYRDVGASDAETLLYGRWPDPAAS